MAKLVFRYLFISYFAIIFSMVSVFSMNREASCLLDKNMQEVGNYVRNLERSYLQEELSIVQLRDRIFVELNSFNSSENSAEALRRIEDLESLGGLNLSRLEIDEKQLLILIPLINAVTRNKDIKFDTYDFYFYLNTNLNDVPKELFNIYSNLGFIQTDLIRYYNFDFGISSYIIISAFYNYFTESKMDELLERIRNAQYLEKFSNRYVVRKNV